MRARLASLASLLAGLAAAAAACTSAGAPCAGSQPGERMLALTRTSASATTELSVFDVGGAKPCQLDLRPLVPVPLSLGWGQWAPHGGAVISVDATSLQVVDLFAGVGGARSVATSGTDAWFDATGDWAVWMQPPSGAGATTVVALALTAPTWTPTSLGDAVPGLSYDDVAFEPARDRFAEGGIGVLRVVDLSVGGPTSHDWSFATSVVVKPTWSPAGRFIAAAVDERGGTAVIDTAAPAATPLRLAGPFAWSPDGYRLAVDAGGGTTILDLTSGTAVTARVFPGVYRAAWLDPVHLIAAGATPPYAADTSLLELDADTGQSTTLVTDARDWLAVPAHAVAYRVADGTWRWLRIGDVAHALPACAAPSPSPDGRFLACVAPPQLVIADTTTGTSATVDATVSREPTSVRWAADSRRAWIDGPEVLVLDPTTRSTMSPVASTTTTIPIGWEPPPGP